MSNKKHTINPTTFVWDNCLNSDNTNEEQYEDFKTAIMMGGTVPVLIDGKIMIYRFALSENTKGLLEKIIEIKEIPTYTVLRHCVCYQNGDPRIITREDGILSVDDFRSKVTEEDLKDYIKNGETAESAFDRWIEYFRVKHYPTHKEKVSSKLSQALYHSCEYADLDYLAGIIYEYLYGEKKSFYEKGPHNYPEFQMRIDMSEFNETEKQVKDKKFMICETLKSLDIELCETIDMDEITDYTLSRIFNPKIDEETTIEIGTLRNFIKKYAEHNADIMFNSELFDIFTNLELPNKKGKRLSYGVK